jgi:hypothetical protein
VVLRLAWPGRPGEALTFGTRWPETRSVVAHDLVLGPFGDQDGPLAQGSSALVPRAFRSASQPNEGGEMVALVFRQTERSAPSAPPSAPIAAVRTEKPRGRPASPRAVATLTRHRGLRGRDGARWFLRPGPALAPILAPRTLLEVRGRVMCPHPPLGAHPWVGVVRQEVSRRRRRASSYHTDTP